MVHLRITMPEEVHYIIQTLEDAGFEAYAVGGCVRDSLLFREPLDWDITTSADPETVKGIFHRTIDTGIAHGTVTVMLGKTGYEVTAYRVDGIYKDGRHPEQVVFTKSLAEDLKRRDFTINAMAYNEKDGVIDLFGGLLDLQNGIVRCVGSAEERFLEDALRMLRAVRFAAQLHFTIEEQTRQAVIRNVQRLTCISAERIRIECNKILLSGHPEQFILAYETGITKVILPEFDKMAQDSEDAVNHALKALIYLQEQSGRFELLHIRQKQAAAWALLLGRISGIEGTSEETAGRILKRFKFDNETIDITTRLIRHFTYPYEKAEYGLTPAGIRQAAAVIGEDIIELLFFVQEAAAGSFGGHEDMKRSILSEAAQLYQGIQKNGECFSLKNLAVRGNDLISAGHQPGPFLGELLNHLLESVILHPEWNQKEILIEKARQWNEK